ENGKRLVAQHNNRQPPSDAVFTLGNVSKLRPRLAEACQWDPASTSSGNSAPNAPARAAGALGAELPDEVEAGSHWQASARRERSFETFPSVNTASLGGWRLLCCATSRLPFS